jgi:hypothetical protein
LWLLALLAAHSAAAAEGWEQQMMKQGWVKLTSEELKAHTDLTAYGGDGWFAYVNPAGTEIRIQLLAGPVMRGTREITGDGVVCDRYEGKLDYPWMAGEREVCSTIWKKGERYLFVERDGMRGPEYTTKPGNPEKL